jgi:hypothetical protein
MTVRMRLTPSDPDPAPLMLGCPISAFPDDHLITSSHRSNARSAIVECDSQMVRQLPTRKSHSANKSNIWSVFNLLMKREFYYGC